MANRFAWPKGIASTADVSVKYGKACIINVIQVFSAEAPPFGMPASSRLVPLKGVHPK